MEHLKKRLAKDAPLEAEKLSLTEELSLLKVGINKAKEDLAEFTLTSKEVGKQQGVLDELLSKIETKKKELVEKESKVSQSKAISQKLSIEIANSKDEQEKLVIENKHLKETSRSLTTSVELLEKVEESFNGIGAEIKKKTDILETLSSDTILAGQLLEEKNDEVTVLEGTIETLNTEKERVEKKISYDIFEMEIREGLLSDKESWLLDKETKLRTMKTELEVFYSRKFPWLII